MSQIKSARGVRMAIFFVAQFFLLSIARADTAQYPLEASYGPRPQLPAPHRSIIPTVNVAPAKGWPTGTTPRADAGMRVGAFATDLDHPRWLYVLPNGDVLVAETNAPYKPDDRKGIKGWFMRHYMKVAGSAGPSANRITLLRDSDGDGKAEYRIALIQELNSPFGMALIGDRLYIACTDAILSFGYDVDNAKISGPGVKLTDLPAGSINHHWTKNLIASADGRELYVTIGSNSNAAENGIEAETGRAAIWQVDVDSGEHRIFASGLRNPVGMAWEPNSGALWTVVNERDELGSDLVPDYLTSVRGGGFYGWPYSYYGGHVDERVQPRRPALVASALIPDYAVGAHTASLGLTWSTNDGSAGAANAAGRNALPQKFAEGMFIGQHGSWNRKPLSGYKVIFVPFKNGMPDGDPIDVLTGFLTPDGGAYGRPVGVAIDRHGGLLVADDVGNTVWRVSGAPLH